MREHLKGGVEQHGALDPLGVAGGELGDEPAAEAVPHPHGRPVGHGLEDRCEVRVDVPRRLPGRVAVPEEVEARGVAAGRGEPVEAAAVRGHAVQADHRHRPRLAPLVDVQSHGR